jgi:hypothetical protein
MDDNYDTCKTTNIKNNQLVFLTLEQIFNFLNLILLVTALQRISSPISTFKPVKSFIHVSVHLVSKILYGPQNLITLRCPNKDKLLRRIHVNKFRYH